MAGEGIPSPMLFIHVFFVKKWTIMQIFSFIYKILQSNLSYIDYVSVRGVMDRDPLKNSIEKQYWGNPSLIPSLSHNNCINFQYLYFLVLFYFLVAIALLTRVISASNSPYNYMVYLFFHTISRGYKRLILSWSRD